MRAFLVMLLLLPLGCLAQFKIYGKVIDATDGKPISYASAFLTNTTIGQRTDVDGSFTLSMLRPGRYELVVTVVGFEAYNQTVMINSDIDLGQIKLVEKTTMMKEVRIVGNDIKRDKKLQIFRDKKLQIFKEQFLGASPFSSQCKIVNPDILELTFSQQEQVLTGSTNDMLEVRNNALGYVLKYLVNSFVLDRVAGTVAYEGSVLFEDMDGTPSKRKKWEKNRQQVYFGSSTHFLRQVLANRVDSNYLVRDFCIKQIEKDSSFTFDTLHPVNYVHPTDQRGVLAMGYNSSLDVYHYIPNDSHHAGGNLVVTMTFLDPNLFFDGNGTVLNPTGTLFRNAWGYSRIAELLPIDYWPETEEQPAHGKLQKKELPNQRKKR